MGRAAARVLVKQAGCRMHQEPHQRALGLGELERALECTPRGRLVAGGIPGDSLEQERLGQPGLPADRGAAVEHRRQLGGGGGRIALGQPQHRGRDADIRAVAVALRPARQDRLGLRPVTGKDHRMQEPGLH
jgi:hypothetical protein